MRYTGLNLSQKYLDSSAAALRKDISLELRINPRKTVLAIYACIVVLIVLHIIACIPYICMGKIKPIGVLNMDAERNIPTVFSALLLWFCSLLTVLIAWAKTKSSGWYHAIPWFGLAFAFFFIGVDETVELHERLTEPMREYFNTRGLLFFAWIIPYTALALLFGLAYIRFTLLLPRDTRKQVLVAALLFLSGSIGMEMFGGAWREGVGYSPVYYLLAMVEEALEMFGAAYFICAFLNYIDKYMPGFSLHITSS